MLFLRGEGEVTRLGGGESYRPITSRPRSPPRIDSFRSGRDRDNSPRRERARTPPTDSWHPNRDRSPRRRSRTPPRRDRSPTRDNWRARPRSPMRDRTPPRRFSPRRDDDRRARSPARRDERRRSRSPYDRDRAAPRARSPLSRRSPPAGPRASYRGRSRSPERRDSRAPTGPGSSNWRRRSPSPPARDSGRSSERTSGTTSRRSSPPMHPERLHLTQATTRESRPRSPPTRDRSPPSQPAYRERDSARSTPRERSPVRPVAPRSPPRGPAGFRAPTGPSSGRNFTAPSPSTVHNAPTSISAHSRPENVGPVIPPSGPRGYVPPARGGYSIRGGRGGYGGDRINRTDSSTWGAAPPSRPVAEIPPRGIALASRPAPSLSPSIPPGPAATTPMGPSGGIPTGPRAGVAPRPSLQHSTSVYGSRPNAVINNNSGPRPHPAMANLPQIIPGGRIDPTASGIPSEIAARLKRKEEEAELLREELHAKQEKLRQGLKGWDKLSRDSQSMGLRSELSERHVRMLAGEGVGGAAF
ncbi:hypothetical protein V8E51_006502 [Hyaloscypha variabilis]